MLGQVRLSKDKLMKVLKEEVLHGGRELAAQAQENLV